MHRFMNNEEYDVDFCEYNPRSVELEKELKALVAKVESPNLSLFQGFMKRIMLSSSTQN